MSAGSYCVTSTEQYKAASVSHLVNLEFLLLLNAKVRSVLTQVLQLTHMSHLNPIRDNTNDYKINFNIAPPPPSSMLAEVVVPTKILCTFTVSPTPATSHVHPSRRY